MFRVAPLLAPVLTAALLAGCGAGTGDPEGKPEHSAPRHSAEEASRARERRLQIAVEASDLNPKATCAAWLETSEPAQVKYVRRHWDRLHPAQAKVAVRQQSLSCRYAPPSGAHHPMGPLQPAVSLAVVGFQVFYEEALREGDHETVSHFFYQRVVGALHW